ncbi:MAG: recombinase family protein [Alicyclobacillus herbarius]|uniref:recombinase family protein n=1 Tax=Alicyclobacillus herbarius TaxID=122960 RepID=UPI0023566817|nr:recombinase family protein [Alicyclobacillus herbarius]MCL6633722.1 recombinase family protein [Alicyclobacillus herbarius]
MIFGYARVSTEDQNLDLQIDALQQYGAERIFQEKISGERRDRPQLDEMLKYLRPGDTVVVWKLDRIGRSTKHLIDLISGFGEKDIHFVSLKESIDTSTATGKLVFTIFAALAEFERDMIRERTKAGLASARARGRKGGRPRKAEDKVKLALKMYDSKQYSITEITKATGVSKTTLYRYIKKRSNV